MLDDTENRVFWRLLFDFCGLPHNPQVPCKHPTKDHEIEIGWPDIQLGVSTKLDPKAIAAFRRAGWVIHELPADTLNRVTPFLRVLHDLTIDRTVRESTNTATHQVSKEENRLLDALLRSGLPEPDRNYTYTAPHGQRTTPDMTWEHVHLAVFVDGLFHHGGRDRDQIIKAAAADPDTATSLETAEQSRITKDAGARRAMVADGWRTIVVADTELNDPDQIAEIAYEIVTAYRQTIAS